MFYRQRTLLCPSACPIAFLKDRVDSFVTVAGAGFLVEHRGAHGRRERPKPGHARMAQQIASSAAVAGYGAAIVDVHLSALPIELGFGESTTRTLHGRPRAASDPGLKALPRR